jgi:hypothetical protein
MVVKLMAKKAKKKITRDKPFYALYLIYLALFLLRRVVQKHS